MKQKAKRTASFFRKIADYLDHKAVGPFELTDTQIRQLQELRGTEEWGVYLEMLDKACTLVGEGMLTARDTAVLHEQRGRVLGLRAAGSLIDEIVDTLKTRHGTDERRRSNIDDELERLVAATVNSPAWTR